MDKEHIGIVIDNNDELKLGRCKVKVFSVYDNIPNENIPYAIPSYSFNFAGGESGGFGQLSVPKIGTVVKVRFIDDDINQPEWIAPMHLNKEAQSFISETYLNSHLINWDEDEQLRIYYTPSNGLQLYLRDSSITINPDESILINHRDSLSNMEFKDGRVILNANDSILENSPFIHINGDVVHLGTTPTFSVIAGEILLTALDALAVLIDLKLFPTPGAATAIVAQARASLSNTVKTSL